MDSATLSSGPDAAAIIEVAQEATDPRALQTEEIYSIIVPAGAEARILSLEEFKDNPDRARGTYKPATVEAFIDYVEKHLAAEDHTTVWVHPTQGCIEAILDDNAPDKPAWRSHRALLELIVTPEWKFWLEHDGKLMGQQDFAEKIEDGMREVHKPDAAEMLEIAQSIQAKTDVNFRSSYQVHNGEVQMAYDEKVEASAGRAGVLSVPQTFVLAIAPFVGEDAYRITARLRVRFNDGELRIGYRLEQPERAVRDVLEGIAKRVAEKFDRVYMGTPAA